MVDRLIKKSINQVRIKAQDHKVSINHSENTSLEKDDIKPDEYDAKIIHTRTCGSLRNRHRNRDKEDKCWPWLRKMI